MFLEGLSILLTKKTLGGGFFSCKIISPFYHLKMDLLQTETQLKSVLQEAIDRHGSATMLNVVQNVILSQFRIGVKDDQMYLCATFEDEIFVAPMNTVLLDDTHIVEIKQEENTDVEEDYIVENLVEIKQE